MGGGNMFAHTFTYININKKLLMINRYYKSTNLIINQLKGKLNMGVSIKNIHNYSMMFLINFILKIIRTKFTNLFFLK